MDDLVLVVDLADVVDLGVVDDVGRVRGVVAVVVEERGDFLPDDTGVFVTVMCFLVGPVMVRSSSVTVRTVTSPPFPLPCFLSP